MVAMKFPPWFGNACDQLHLRTLEPGSFDRLARIDFILLRKTVEQMVKSPRWPILDDRVLASQEHSAYWTLGIFSELLFLLLTDVRFNGCLGCQLVVHWQRFD